MIQSDTAFVSDISLGTEYSSPWVEFLSLSHFRCYESLSLQVDRRPVVLTGDNGAGKTNILEALSFLSPGRGLRRSKLSQPTHFHHMDKGWSVFAKVSVDGLLEDIGTGILAGGGSEDRRVIKVNQTAISQSDLMKLVTVFWMTPQIDQLLNESMGTRRRFFDKLVASFLPEHTQHLSRYEYAIRERARLLKENRGDDQWLSILEQKMAQEGMAIFSLRQLFLDAISPLVQLSSSGFPKVKIYLEGALESLSDQKSALEAEDEIQHFLKRSRAEDGRLGSTPLGPHQTQVQFFHIDGKKNAEFCSTGEQKALLLSLILANCRLHRLHKGKTPIVLLDEVVAHLDEERRGNLYKEILGLGLQCWMTGTDEKVFAPFGDAAQYLYVHQGKVSR